MCADSLTADVELAARIDLMAPQLAAASLAYMPRDPFWEERYGERGRRFASEDAGFHLRYLRDAFSAGSQDVLDHYGRWLRDLLVARGMCTRHLQEHFEHLASALDATMGDPRPGASMRRAAAALRYESAEPAAVQNAAPAIGERLGRAPDGHSAWDPLFLTHYVADAVARQDPATLAAHITWARARNAGFDAIMAGVSASLGRYAETAAGERMVALARSGVPPAA